MIKRKKKDHKTASFTRRQGVREVKQSFLIICEGENTEPDYFKAFRMTAATVKALGEAMNTMSLVNKAINIREAEKSKKRFYNQCWVVFDKDDYSAKDFNQAIQLAEKNGFQVASAARGQWLPKRSGLGGQLHQATGGAGLRIRQRHHRAATHSQPAPADGTTQSSELFGQGVETTL